MIGKIVDIDVSGLARKGFELIRFALKHGQLELAQDIAEALHNIPDENNKFQADLTISAVANLIERHPDGQVDQLKQFIGQEKINMKTIDRNAIETDKDVIGRIVFLLWFISPILLIILNIKGVLLLTPLGYLPQIPEHMSYDSVFELMSMSISWLFIWLLPILIAFIDQWRI